MALKHRLAPVIAQGRIDVKKFPFVVRSAVVYILGTPLKPKAALVLPHGVMRPLDDLPHRTH